MPTRWHQVTKWLPGDQADQALPGNHTSARPGISSSIISGTLDTWAERTYYLSMNTDTSLENNGNNAPTSDAAGNSAGLIAGTL